MGMKIQYVIVGQLDHVRFLVTDQDNVEREEKE